MRLKTVILLFVTCVFGGSQVGVADEPLTLMGILSPWTYPDSVTNGAQMSDAATVNSEGNRTVQSFVCKTTMTTDDPIEKVLAFYKAKLTPDQFANAETKAQLQAGRSVLVSDDSDGRPFSIHTILVNTEKTSTTLIISRADSEKKTHIVWKRYVRI
ncbi:hypothetical protein [Neorhodopirellula lusitana]|uniref:hypothetical protein n=1 Tax=Neorhodopirellula lusitana TaxID=445327 RepID=UPI00384DB7C9